MKTYTARPSTPSGKIAWDAFVKAIGAAPVSMSYGHAGAPVGWQWTAEDRDGSIYTYKASWASASFAYDGTRSHFPSSP